MKTIKNDIVIYPTDTVWGIGGSILSEAAYQEIAKIKQTKFDKPLSIMFYDFNEIENTFKLPSFMTKEWLQEFFKLEATLGLSTKLLKVELPEWLVSKSDFLSIRFLETKEIKEIGEYFKTPFFTTSLNLTTHPPIVSKDEALKFKNQHAPHALFYSNEKSVLSGESSTIIFFEENNFRLIRKGQKYNELALMILRGTGLNI